MAGLEPQITGAGVVGATAAFSYASQINTESTPAVLVELVGTMRGRTRGRVDGFDQDEAESKRDERAVILRGLLASKCDTLEAFELADRLFDARPCLVECFSETRRAYWKAMGKPLKSVFK